jgi:uncharacterized protein YaiI (UPF0178 family)
MKIIIDADACPKAVLQCCQHAGKKWGVEVYTVASFAHEIENPFHVVVDNDSQAADLKIINMTKAKDIVVTQDWGLAAMVLGRAAFCLNPLGFAYDPNKMDFLLEEREVKAKLRRSGGRTKGPRKRTAAADERFAQTLEMTIQEAIKA